jgi:hypothetical protein
MKRANKIRKIVTRVAAGVMFALLLAFNLQIGWAQPNSSNLSLSALTQSSFTTAEVSTGMTCKSGDGSTVCHCTNGCAVTWRSCFCT